jgi:hypothetical protein
MVGRFKAQLAVPVLVGISFALIALPTGCSGMGGHQNTTAGNQELRSGIAMARSGIQQYQAGDTAVGLDSIQQGRAMMGQSVIMMGLGCCLLDGGVLDGSAMANCTAMMGPGASPMLQGMAQFDAAQAMMSNPDAGSASQAMINMETAMKMMEQGADQMMVGKGSMSGMMN